LVLPDFRCELNSADRDRRCIEAFETQHRSDPLLDAAMVLLRRLARNLANRRSSGCSMLDLKSMPVGGLFFC
jgi:hypothetical protein